MIKPSIQKKLAVLTARYTELGKKMSQPEIISEQNIFQQYAKEYAQLEPVVNAFTTYHAIEQAIAQAESLMKDTDSEMQALAKEEWQALKKQQEDNEHQLYALLLPVDPNDNCNVFLEIRAGTGGDEASLFAGNLLKMYSRYAEIKRWKIHPISGHESEQGGFKEVIIRITGKQVYAQLKFESGAHRVQRVPETESQGRIHTSACTVAVLPEIETVDNIDIQTADLRVDTYRASGAGGQHVNKTDSAVRITHLPSGIVVECQDERSQHKNRAQAMSLLHAKLLSTEQEKQRSAEAETRRNLIGSGDRSERIRTYNFPQGRVTDHRIQLTLYKIEEIMQGQLDHLIEPLKHEHQTDLLAAIDE